MLVKIWLNLTKSVTTGDTDEVRVQSEEPNSKNFAFIVQCNSSTLSIDSLTKSGFVILSALDLMVGGVLLWTPSTAFLSRVRSYGYFCST